MANVKISQLPQTSVVCNNALIPLVQNGVTCSTYACNLGGGGGVVDADTGCNSTVRIGANNCASGNASTVLGCCNTASGCYSTISGGYNNTASCNGSFVGAGQVNCNTGVNTSIIGGTTNIIGCYDLSTATCLTTSSCVYCANASTNSIYMYGDYTADLQVGNCLAYFNCYDNKTYSGVVTCSTYSGYYTEIKGICAGTCSGYICTPIRNLSCVCNAITNNSVIVGGIGNIIYNKHSFIGSGCGNTISGCYSAIAGGACNTASGYYTFVGGGVDNTASCSSSFVGGGAFNTSSNGSFIGTGLFNTTSGSYSFVGSGSNNTASGGYSFVGGGTINIASGNCSFVGGGRENTASGQYSFVGAGILNTTASSNRSGVLSGCCNNTCGFADVMIIGSNLNATQACTTFTNCLSADNLTVGSGVCVGANKVLVNYPLSYGQFSQSGTLTATLANTEYLIPFDTIKFNNGVSVVSNSQITMANAGVYKIQFSSVFAETGGGQATVSMWFKKNGTPIANSNTEFVVKNNENSVAAWDYLESFTAGQYIELAWSSNQANSTQMLSIGTQTTPTRPATPSIIVTIIRVA